MAHTPERRVVQTTLDPETFRQFKVAVAEGGLSIATVLSVAVEGYIRRRHDDSPASSWADFAEHLAGPTLPRAVSPGVLAVHLDDLADALATYQDGGGAALVREAARRFRVGSLMADQGRLRRRAAGPLIRKEGDDG